MASDDQPTYEQLINQVTQLPQNWSPRREQPSWDRFFTGSADIDAQFTGGTDLAATWAREALAFSDVVLHGFESKDELLGFGSQARKHIRKGLQQGLD